VLRRREGRGKGYGLRRRGRNELWFAAAWGGGGMRCCGGGGEKGCCGCALGFAGGGGLDEGEDKGLRVWGGGVEGGIRIRLRLVGWHGC
jgi:hypothetical protein